MPELDNPLFAAYLSAKAKSFPITFAAPESKKQAIGTYLANNGIRRNRDYTVNFEWAVDNIDAPGWRLDNLYHFRLKRHAAILKLWLDI